MKEIWRAIPGSQDSAEASNLGRIRRIPIHGLYRNCVMVCTVNGSRGLRIRENEISGYYVVPIKIAGYTRPRYIHKLVLAAFVGPCPEGIEGDHKNFDKHDNRLDNLEYVTKLENVRRAHKAGRIRYQYGPVNWMFGRTGKNNPAYGKHPSGKDHPFYGQGHRYVGTKNPNAKLTWSVVRDIRHQLKSGAHPARLAKLYLVTSTTIRHIATNKTWVRRDKLRKNDARSISDFV